MSSGAEPLNDLRRISRRRESLDEQVRRRGLKPIESVEDLKCDGVFETDEELDALPVTPIAGRDSARQREPGRRKLPLPITGGSG